MSATGRTCEDFPCCGHELGDCDELPELERRLDAVL